MKVIKDDNGMIQVQEVALIQWEAFVNYAHNEVYDDLVELTWTYDNNQQRVIFDRDINVVQAAYYIKKPRRLGTLFIDKKVFSYWTSTGLYRDEFDPPINLDNRPKIQWSSEAIVIKMFNDILKEVNNDKVLG